MKKFRCETCDLSFKSAYEMREHFKSYEHRAKADFSNVDVMLNKFGELLRGSNNEPDKV